MDVPNLATTPVSVLSLFFSVVVVSVAFLAVGRAPTSASLRVACDIECWCRDTGDAPVHQREGQAGEAEAVQFETPVSLRAAERYRMNDRLYPGCEYSGPSRELRRILPVLVKPLGDLRVEALPLVKNWTTHDDCI